MTSSDDNVARKMGVLTYLMVIGLPIILFTVLLTLDSFAKESILKLYPLIFSTLCGCGLIWITKSFINNKSQIKKQNKPIQLTFAAFIVGVSAGGTVFVIFLMLVQIIIYTTSFNHVEFNTVIKRAYASKGCSVGFAYYDSYLNRDITICADQKLYKGAKSGDVITVSERTGPFGGSFLRADKAR